MARFVLQPCKLREDRLVPLKEPAVELSWRDLCKRLAPSGDQRALRVLQMVQVNSYVGLTRTGEALTNFVLTNADRSGNLARVLAKDPTFVSRLVEVYRVDHVVWDSRTIELPGVQHGRPRSA